MAVMPCCILGPLMTDVLGFPLIKIIPGIIDCVCMQHALLLSLLMVFILVTQLVGILHMFTEEKCHYFIR